MLMKMDIFYNNTSAVLLMYSTSPTNYLEDSIVSFESNDYTFGFYYSNNCTLNENTFLYTGRRIFVEQRILQYLPQPPRNSIKHYFKRTPTDDEYISKIIRYLKTDGESQSLKIKCPFHNDRNPSLSFSTTKGIFYCFSCHQKGTSKRLWNALINSVSVESKK